MREGINYIEPNFSLAAIGFNVETVTYKNIKFQVWDLGGQTSIRPYWRCYYPNTQVCIVYCPRGCHLCKGQLESMPDVDKVTQSRL